MSILRNLMTRALQVVLMLAAIGCENGEPDGNTAPPPRTAASVAPSGGGASSTSPTVPGAGPLGVRTGRSAEHGAYLADTIGRALYVLEQDPEGTTSCYDACARVWPPFLAAGGAPTAADPAVKQPLLGTIARRDGGVQVTYNGHALYYYQGDDGPGQTNGHHVQYTWGEWYLMTPEGSTAHQSPERRPPR